jgi:hypothetical protein
MCPMHVCPMQRVLLESFRGTGNQGGTFHFRTSATLVKAPEVSVIRVKSGVLLRFLHDNSMGITLLRENQCHVTCLYAVLI